MAKNKSQRKGADFEREVAHLETKALAGMPIEITVRRTPSQERFKTRTGDVGCFHKPHSCVLCGLHQELKQYQDMTIGQLEDVWAKTKADAQWKTPVLVIRFNNRFSKDTLVVQRVTDWLKEKGELEGYRQKQ